MLVAGSVRIAADAHRALRGCTIEIDAYAWCLLPKLPKLLYLRICAKTNLFFQSFSFCFPPTLLPRHLP